MPLVPEGAPPTMRAPLEPRAARDACLEAVKLDGWALRFTAEELRADREVVLAAIKQAGRALQFATSACRVTQRACSALARSGREACFPRRGPARPELPTGEPIDEDIEVRRGPSFGEVRRGPPAKYCAG